MGPRLGAFPAGRDLFSRRVRLEPYRVYVRDGDVEIDVTVEDCAGFEVYRPADQAYIWSRKEYSREARGVVRYGETERELIRQMSGAGSPLPVPGQAGPATVPGRMQLH